jgi:hypothetical protein
MTTTNPTAHLDPTFQPYQRFWVVTESLPPRIYGRSGLTEAIAQFQILLRKGDSPRFLGEQADDSLHDLSLPEPAVSAFEADFETAFKESCGQKYPIPKGASQCQKNSI